MSHETFDNEDELRRAVRDELDAGPLPAGAQARLNNVYASLGSIPQDRPAAPGAPAPQQRAAGAAQHAAPGRARVARRGMVVAVAAVMVVLLSGAAYAATSLLQMGPGGAGFFESGRNLPVFNSMQAAASGLSAEVGQTVGANGVRITLDSVSSDRNVANLYFTMEKDGGFDLDAQSIYEGSNENEWVRLQNIAPMFRYELLTTDGQSLGTGTVSKLDAYLEDGALKCMERIVPEAVLPDQVIVKLTNAYSSVLPDEGGEGLTFDVGLDLSTVAQPRDLGAQDIVFDTSDGQKTLHVARLTASELGTVLVTKNEWVMGDDGMSSSIPDNVLSPTMVKMTDDQGNVLRFVNPGDGGGYSLDGPTAVELAGLASDATSVTFTPMLETDAAKAGNVPGNDEAAVEARKALNAQNEQQADVSQIGAQLPTSEYGGYTVADWTVENSTVTIKLAPYGWDPSGLYGMFELIPDDDNVTLLADEWTDPETGETGTGYHSAIRYEKYDYLTGDLVQMDSYYAASDDELRGLTNYHYRSMFGYFQEDAEAAQTLSF
ncbi:DUF4179 domain-containing protein [Eggerthella sinensis]|uniref:DUF4179 domain-containing protein n=1 Tax=Eggerthella sinensis TaxID=242230 RepID=UPI00266DC031|nr:DUF4179 domain-containing protein [Eggerthella sinensis]